MFLIVVALLYLIAVANSLQQISTTPAQRSAALITSWNSAGCQHYYRKNFFATTESQLKCSQRYSLYRCPAFDRSHFDGFVLPLSPAEKDARWNCQKTFEQSVRRTALVDMVSKIIFVNNFEGENLPNFTNLLELLMAKYSFVEMDIFEITEGIEDYFVFTFISDPMEHMLRSWVDDNHGRTLETVLALKKDACVLDPHFWTLPMFLHITTKNGGSPLAYNFIGTIENYTTDFPYLESILPTPPPPPPPPPPPLPSFVNSQRQRPIIDEAIVARSSSNKYERVAPANINPDPERKSTMEKRALCSLLKMDYQCFGGYYTVPAVCGYQ